MVDPAQRIVVDGVDFASVVRFPRILRSVTAAIRPPRLVVALLMVVLFVAAGRTWDALTEARVNPAGLLAGVRSAEDDSAAQDLMGRALVDYGALVDGLPDERLEPGAVIERIERAYRARRAVEPDASRRRTDDVEFRAVVSSIRSAAPMGAFEATTQALHGTIVRTVRGVINLRPGRVLTAGEDLFMEVPVQLWRQERVFAVIFGLLLLVIAGIGGGALSRMAACDIASREHLRVVDGFDFALSHWVRLILTPILPLVIAGILAALLVLFGVLFVPWVDVVGGPLYGVALILGFLLSFVLLGFAVGFPLLIPADAVAHCDAADAQQRAYAYVLHRPLHLLGYGATAIAGLALGYVVVAFVVATSLNVTGTLTGIVTGSGAAAGAGGFGIFDLSQPVGGALDDAWHAQWSAAFVGFWQRVVIDLVAAYVVSYFFSSSTWIYLLMRQACDGQDIEEVTQD